MNARQMKSGLIAGLAATIALSVLMVMKSAMGLMPNVNAIKMLTQMGSAYLHTPAVPLMGWIAHFAIGTILWGFIFAATYQFWPTRSATVKGVEFSVVAWLMMMLVAMPMAGAGLFGAHLGMPAPVATLVLHLLYGAVLGFVYGKLASVGAGTGAGAPPTRQKATH